MRDRIDTAGIAARETQHHNLRSVRTWWDTAGMHCGTWRLPPEDGTLIAETLDQILSPRRGGPRFTDPTEQHRADALTADPRTNEQITADTLTDLIRVAIDTDPRTLLGTRRPAVRILVTADHLYTHAEHHRAEHVSSSRTATTDNETGTEARTRTIVGSTDTDASTSTSPSPSPSPSPMVGWIEGRGDTVSADTVDRHLCNVGAISIGFDQDGQCVNVGRTRRLFTERQRIGLSVRDAGCRFPGCDRPPSWCEAHHINPWDKDHGRTDIADGILLCRRHHLLLHNNHWTITRTHTDYLLHPPKDIDSEQTPIHMPSHSPVAPLLHSHRSSA